MKGFISIILIFLTCFTIFIHGKSYHHLRIDSELGDCSDETGVWLPNKECRLKCLEKGLKPSCREVNLEIAHCVCKEAKKKLRYKE